MSYGKRRLLLALAVIFAFNIAVISLGQSAEAASYKRGSTGSVVRQIQQKLLNWGYYSGEVDGIYLNFCDPWPKSRDAKHRLTAPGFLRLYADVLPVGGTLRFKTDNLPLFTWSVEQFTAEGWALSEVTNDLHAGGVCGVMTDYEAKFHAQGVKINRLAATRTHETKTTAAGTPERLRNASLSDAKGKQEGLA